MCNWLCGVVLHRVRHVFFVVNLYLGAIKPSYSYSYSKWDTRSLESVWYFIVLKFTLIFSGECRWLGLKLWVTAKSYIWYSLWHHWHLIIDMTLANWLVQLTCFTDYHVHHYVRTQGHFVSIIYHIYESDDEEHVMFNLFEKIALCQTY